MPSRRGKQCRDRYVNNLAPNINRGEWTEVRAWSNLLHASLMLWARSEEYRPFQEEEKILAQGWLQLGHKWAALARLLPGRPENAVKNHWRVTVALSQSQRLVHVTVETADPPRNAGAPRSPRCYQRSRSHCSAAGDSPRGRCCRSPLAQAFPPPLSRFVSVFRFPAPTSPRRRHATLRCKSTHRTSNTLSFLKRFQLSMDIGVPPSWETAAKSGGRGSKLAQKHEGGSGHAAQPARAQRTAAATAAAAEKKAARAAAREEEEAAAAAKADAENGDSDEDEGDEGAADGDGPDADMADAGEEGGCARFPVHHIFSLLSVEGAEPVSHIGADSSRWLLRRAPVPRRAGTMRPRPISPPPPRSSPSQETRRAISSACRAHSLRPQLISAALPLFRLVRLSVASRGVSKPLLKSHALRPLREWSLCCARTRARGTRSFPSTLPRFCPQKSARQR